jgi:protein-tyrosine phosphatase
VIDLHCHLLPAVDDGPRTLEDAFALADGLVAAGITQVAATPHVSADYPNEVGRIRMVRGVLKGELERRGVQLTVLAGAEIDLGHVTGRGSDELVALRLGDSAALLVECPFARVAPDFESRVQQLMARGHRVLLAHPERSPLFLHEPSLLARLVGQGALSSVTAASFAGRFGRTASRFAAWAIDEGLVHSVATDAHNTRNRPPLLREPLIDSGYEWALDWLTEDVPAAILRDAPLPAAPSPPRSWLGAKRHGRRREAETG